MKSTVNDLKNCKNEHLVINPALNYTTTFQAIDYAWKITEEKLSSNGLNGDSSNFLLYLIKFHLIIIQKLSEAYVKKNIFCTNQFFFFYVKYFNFLRRNFLLNFFFLKKAVYVNLMSIRYYYNDEILKLNFIWFLIFLSKKL